MKIRALKFSAIWCPATTVAPSPPISRAITAKMLDSANTAMPMGPPTESRRLITGSCGLSKRSNNRLGR
ncbi:hypothetical protein FQZ97_909720 [compost metagenome]